MENSDFKRLVVDMNAFHSGLLNMYLNYFILCKDHIKKKRTLVAFRNKNQMHKLTIFYIIMVKVKWGQPTIFH